MYSCRLSHVFAATLLLALGMVLLAGCDQSSNTPVKEKESPPTEIRLGYCAELTQAQALLGLDSGDFAKAVAPAKLQPRIFNNSFATLEALAAREIDIAYLDPGPAAISYANNPRNFRIVSGAAANGSIIIAVKDLPIKSLRDLIGHRVATPLVGNTQDIAARRYFKRILIVSDLSNITPSADAKLLQAMQNHQIDAAWLSEPWASCLIAQGIAYLVEEEKDMWPDDQFSSAILVASPEMIRRYPSTLAKFITAHRQWTANLKQDAAKQLPALQKSLQSLTKREFPPGALELAITRIKYTNDPVFSSIETMAKWAYDLGFLKDPPELDGMLDPNFFPPQKPAH